MSFQDFATAQGLILHSVIPDGRVHRCKTQDHPKRRNGAWKFDGVSGWAQNWAIHSRPVVYRPDREELPDGEALAALRARAKAERQATARNQAKAAQIAAETIQRCRIGPHPYLERKGFRTECGLIDGDRLIVPMRDVQDYGRVLSVQSISPAGEKKFLFGGRAKGAIYRIGSGSEKWLCEGYATALSIRAALATLYRKAEVVVCFSAGNLAHVAPLLTGRRYVVADNDPVGARAAEETGLPWAMPPAGDANDHHQTAGLRPLAEMLRGML